jgi:hypothetical protein
MSNTEKDYLEVIGQCFDIFSKKNQDYGTSWKILRLPSITDQIYIKAQRIRTIQENGHNLIEEDVQSEFKGIINYCVMAILLSDASPTQNIDLNTSYKKVVDDIRELLFKKNHDYGEAWKLMRVSSMTDIILMKLLRIKQIEDNAGKTIISEGIISGYQDIVNYAVFCLIKLQNNINQEAEQQ